jgi:hypothetical protein
MTTDVRRAVPSVDAILRSDAGRRASVTLGRSLLKLELASVLEEARAAAAAVWRPPSPRTSSPPPHAAPPASSTASRRS